MPRYRDNKPEVDRSRELRTYYETQLNTDAKKLDFFTQIAVLNHNHQKSLLTNKENDVCSELSLENFFQPAKEGPDGNLILDVDLYTKRVKDLLKYQYELELQVARDYQKELKAIPENEPHRESKAAYLAREKEAAVRHIANSSSLVMPVDMDRHDRFVDIRREALAEFQATLTEDELQLLKIGADIVAEEPTILDKVSPEAVGLSDQALEEMRIKTENDLIAKADMNWADKRTMRDVPSFYNPQVTADSEKRSSRYYLAADEEGKKQFIVNGLLQSQLDRDNAAYTAQEKESFKECLRDYFTPLKPDGQPDFDTFEKRMDEMAAYIGEGYVHAGDEIQNGDYSKLLGKYADDPAAKKQAVKKTNEVFLKSVSMRNALTEAAADNIIPAKMIDNYCGRKEEDAEGPFTFGEALYSQMKKSAFSRAGGLESFGIATYEPVGGNPVPQDVSEAVEKAGTAAKNQILSEVREDKDWLRPEDNITKESLRKLSNLYEQLKGEDRWYHYNSDEYEKLRDALKAAHDKYQQVKDSPGELSDVEKHKLIGAYDRISNRAMKYLDSDNRASKTRGTDLGQNRYEQAFAALKTTSEGSAKKRLEIHNRHRIKTGAKQISLDDLEARANRTLTQQKEHEKRVRKNPAAAKKNDGPEMI